MSRPRIVPGPPAREASTLEKSHLDSLIAAYSEPLHGLRLAQRVASTRQSFHHIHTILYIQPSPVSEISLHLLIASKQSEKNLPVIPSRELNSGMPYSKTKHDQELSYVAP